MSICNIPKIKVGDLEFNVIQGGMGVGVSMDGLASAVANEGGAGIIATVGLGALLKYGGDYIKANQDALRDVIREARRRSNGVIGVNDMFALTDFDDLAEVSFEEEVDLFLTGAGPAARLPLILRDRKTKIGPIVSSAKGADFFCRKWGGDQGHYPDLVVVEGPKAGGHLGYKRADPTKPELKDNLDNPEFVAHGLERIIPEVVEVVRSYEAVAGRKIPVVAAGGLYYGGDIAKFIKLGAEGGQMATRFVTTDECDADIRFKQEYIRAGKEDIVLIDSPVGMPGRAVLNSFLKSMMDGGRVKFKCPYRCLKSCKAKVGEEEDRVPYCIADALVEAQQGDFHRGFAFCGSNAYLCKEIVSVKKVVADLDREFAEGKVSS